MDCLLVRVVKADDMAEMVRHRRIGLLLPRLFVANEIDWIHEIDLWWWGW